MVKVTLKMRGKVNYCKPSDKKDVYVTLEDVSDPASKYPEQLNFRFPAGHVFELGRVAEFEIVATVGSFGLEAYDRAGKPLRNLRRVTYTVEDYKVGQWFEMVMKPVDQGQSTPASRK